MYLRLVHSLREVSCLKCLVFMHLSLLKKRDNCCWPWDLFIAVFDLTTERVSHVIVGLKPQ